MRLDPHTRSTVIITAAVSIAKDTGLHTVTHGAVAKRCTIETSKKTVRHYFSTQADLWRGVIDRAPEFTMQGKELGL
jgi:DNA-binding transcriptional regulator YbjK